MVVITRAAADAGSDDTKGAPVSVELRCPWCEAELAVNLADLALAAVTCAECATTVDFAAGPRRVPLPIAA